MNESLRARRVVCDGLRDHFLREFKLALSRHLSEVRFPRAGAFVMRGGVTWKDQEPSIHRKITVIKVQGSPPRNIAHLDHMFRSGRIVVYAIVSVHAIAKYVSTEILAKLGLEETTKLNFCSTFRGPDGDGLDAEGISHVAEILALMAKDRVLLPNG